MGKSTARSTFASATAMAMRQTERSDSGDTVHQLPSYEQSAGAGEPDYGGRQGMNGHHEDQDEDDEPSGSATGSSGIWDASEDKRALHRHVVDMEREDRQETGPENDVHAPRPPSYEDSTASLCPSHLGGPPSPLDTLSRLSINVTVALPNLALTDYGSRRITHSTTPINCTLALDDGLTLIGTTDGIRVLIDNVEDPTRSVWTGLAVWNMTMLRRDPRPDGTARGSVLVHCAGYEDRQMARPKRHGEARVYKLESLASLARWSAAQDRYDGLDLLPKRDKGKGVASTFRAFPSFSTRTPHRADTLEPRGHDLAVRWAGDYTLLPAGGRGVTAVSTRITPTDMAIALATTESISLYLAKTSATGSLSFEPAKTFSFPFPPTSVSILELEIPGSHPEKTSDGPSSSSLFECDDDRAETALGEGVVSGQLGLFVTFAGARGCVIRTSDMRIVELKRGGRGEWQPAQKVILDDGTELYVLTRGSSSFVFSAPLIVPLAMQAPIAEITWPELPSAVYAMAGPDGVLRLLGLTTQGTLHVIDVLEGERGIVQEWASAGRLLGDKPRFVPDRQAGRGDASLPNGRGVCIATQRSKMDWRMARLTYGPVE